MTSRGAAPGRGVRWFDRVEEANGKQKGLQTTISTERKFVRPKNLSWGNAKAVHSQFIGCWLHVLSIC